jgi:serine/threonine protein kinase
LNGLISLGLSGYTSFYFLAIQKLRHMVLATLSRRFASVVWDKTQELGRGSFGVCYAGTLQARSGSRVSWPEMAIAVKVIDRDKTLKDDQLMREVEVMTNDHPALLGLIAWGRRNDHFCLVTARMRTDLEHLLTGIVTLPTWDATTRSITALGIAAGLAHLHSRDIIHRDLKPANVLMSDDCRPRVADFGLARNIPVEEQVQMTGGVGTIKYMAPELINDGDYGLPVDVFAWAFIFWRLITLKTLFAECSSMNEFRIMKYIKEGGRPAIADVLNPVQKELLEKCWDQDPSVRLTFAAILQEPDKLIIDGCDIPAFNAYRDEILKTA